MSGPLHTYFLSLTAVGFDALWGTMVRNGTAQAIGQAKATGTLPSGDGVLRRVYTGLPAVDRFLLSPVIFYDALMGTRSGLPVYRPLLVALFDSMQSASFTMLVSGLRHGVSGSRHPLWPFLESTFWGAFNQSHGAAFVYPVYFFTHLEQITRPARPDGLDLLDEADAEALVCTSVLAAVLPAWLLLPSVLPCSVDTRQWLIASYRAMPAVLAAAPPLLARLLRAVRGRGGSHRPMSASRTRGLVKRALVLSGASAALAHLYAVACGLAATTGGLAAIFWPGATRVPPAGDAAVISQGCHLFLQNDWWVIAAAVVPYASAALGAHCAAKDSRGAHGGDSMYARVETWVAGLSGKWVTLAGLTLLFSPGAVLAWSLAVTV